ncbi:MAG: hypothetical protein COT15_05320 [Candidatus Diapherotrites archaeon CG08_land_8_20_14_0_20_34_12]|nr:MAG: hypothetical protein COT15_05320 [Candidatus Diapherotrites archaeon CG08_land_8_20_14_0_20_34_12]
MPLPTLDDIRSYNPWLKGESFEVPSFKRPIYYEIERIVGKKFIIALTGLRRVGKTTLLKQLGNNLRGEKFFFSFEEDLFANYASLKHVVETFLEMSEKPTIFLDEIGRIKGWAGLLKKYHDLGKAKFIVSGSSALQITKGKESLAGRLMEYTLMPWQFEEFLALKGIVAKKISAKSIEKAYLQWDKIGETEITEFLKKGGFPELLDVQNETDIKKYIRASTIDKIVFEDIPHIFAVEDKDKLYDILCYVARESGNILLPSHLGQALEVSKDTVKKYLFYLKYAYLVELLPIEGSTIKSFRRPKKVYASCPSISYALSLDYDESRLVETAVFAKLNNESKELFFFRDAQKHEVDFTGKLVIESKWKNQITDADLKSLWYFMKKKRIKKAIVVSKHFEVKKKEDMLVYCLPLAFFLLLDLTEFKFK